MKSFSFRMDIQNSLWTVKMGKLNYLMDALNCSGVSWVCRLKYL